MSFDAGTAVGRLKLDDKEWRKSVKQSARDFKKLMDDSRRLRMRLRRAIEGEVRKEATAEKAALRLVEAERKRALRLTLQHSRALAENSKRTLRKQREDAEKLTASLRRMGVAWGLVGAAVTAASAVMARSFIKVADQLEQYQLRLTSLMRSQDAGNALLADMSVLAGQVPQTLEQIIESSVTLAGVMGGSNEEIKRWMPLILDLSSVTGIALRDTTAQVVRMYSAGAQAADRFRERGITAMLGFQGGVAHTAEETRIQLMKSWNAMDSQFKGATGRLAKTWTGTMSMIEDKWFKFRTTFMEETDMFSFLKESLAEFDEALGENMEGLNKWVSENRGLANTFVLAIPIVGNLTAAVGGLALAYSALRTASILTGKSFVKFNLITAASTVAVGLLTAAIIAHKIKVATMAREEKEWAESAVQRYRTLKDLEIERQALAGKVKTEEEGRRLNDVLVGQRKRVDELNAKYKDLNLTMEDARDIHKSFRAVMAPLQQRLIEASIELENQENIRRLLALRDEPGIAEIQNIGKIKALREEVKLLGDTIGDLRRELTATQQVRDTVDTIDKLGKSMSDARKRMDKAAGGLAGFGIFTGAASARKTADEYLNALGKYSTAVKDFQENMRLKAGRGTLNELIGFNKEELKKATDLLQRTIAEGASKKNIETAQEAVFEIEKALEALNKKRLADEKATAAKSLKIFEKNEQAKVEISKALIDAQRQLRRTQLADRPTQLGVFEALTTFRDARAESKSAAQTMVIRKQLLADLFQVSKDAWRRMTDFNNAEIKKRTKASEKAANDEKKLLRERLSAEKEMSRALTNNAELRYRLELRRIADLVRKWKQAAPDLAVQAEMAGFELGERAERERDIEGGSFFKGMSAQIDGATESLGKWGAVGAGAAMAVKTEMSSAISAMIQGTKSASEAWEDFTEGIKKRLADAVSDMITDTIIAFAKSGLMSLFGATKSAFGIQTPVSAVVGGSFGGSPGGLGGLGGALVFANITTGPSLAPRPVGGPVAGPGGPAGPGTHVIELTVVNVVSDAAIAASLTRKPGKNVILNTIIANEKANGEVRKTRRIVS